MEDKADTPSAAMAELLTAYRLAYLSERSEVATLRALLSEAQAEAYRKDRPWLNQV